MKHLKEGLIKQRGITKLQKSYHPNPKPDINIISKYRKRQGEFAFYLYIPSNLKSMGIDDLSEYIFNAVFDHGSRNCITEWVLNNLGKPDILNHDVQFKCIRNNGYYKSCGVYIDKYSSIYKPEVAKKCWEKIVEIVGDYDNEFSLDSLNEIIISYDSNGSNDLVEIRVVLS